MPLTLDRGSATLTTERLGRSQSITPEGFLLCDSVRIARTGPMLYAADEMPDIESENGLMLTILREAEVLFAEDSIASFSGKPITNDHPDGFVTPATWKRDSIGIVLNPRRGEGADAEYLIADLLVTDAQAIIDVMNGKREVSCGYDAAREQIKPGLGRQTKVIGNHVALVDRGRCGPSCAIQDQEGNGNMAKRNVWDRLRTAFKANDEKAFEEELKEAKDSTDDETEAEKKEREEKEAEKKTADAFKKALDAALAPVVKDLAATNVLVAKLAGAVKDADDETEEEKAARLAKEEKEAKEAKDRAAVTDSASMRDAFVDTMARAEILAPGIKLPVFDAKATSKVTIDALCGLRSKALTSAYADPTRKDHVISMLGGKPADFAAMTCDSAELIFRGASELARIANNGAGGGSHRIADTAAGRMTAAKMQEMIVSRRAKKA